MVEVHKLPPNQNKRMTNCLAVTTVELSNLSLACEEKFCSCTGTKDFESENSLLNVRMHSQEDLNLVGLLHFSFKSLTESCSVPYNRPYSDNSLKSTGPDDEKYFPSLADERFVEIQTEGAVTLPVAYRQKSLSTDRSDFPHTQFGKSDIRFSPIKRRNNIRRAKSLQFLNQKNMGFHVNTLAVDSSYRFISTPNRLKFSQPYRRVSFESQEEREREFDLATTAGHCNYSEVESVPCLESQSPAPIDSSSRLNIAIDQSLSPISAPNVMTSFHSTNDSFDWGKFCGDMSDQNISLAEQTSGLYDHTCTELTEESILSLNEKRFKVGFIDTHCHIDFLLRKEDYSKSFKSYISDCESSYPFPKLYEGCVTVFCNPTSFEETLPKNYIIHKHCFMGDAMEAQQWMDYFPNLYLGFTGILTQPTRRARNVKQVAQTIPLNRILLETDAPYFRPYYLKGRKYSHPGMAIHVASAIARLRDIPIEVVLKETRKNTSFVYNI